MKNIVIRLGIIAIVAALAIGATTAYFSDTETSTGNSIIAGTIDISINDTNPWTGGPYTIDDLKPGETSSLDFKVTNVGTNPVNISKKLYNIIGGEGVMSEPECKAEGGQWVNNTTCDGATPVDNMEDQIKYDMSVEVYNSENTKIWWQEIEDGSKTIKNVYPDNDTYVSLGMIPVGGYMLVHQSYHFDETAGNEYQGDTLTFDIEFKGTQLVSQTKGYATVALENKSGAPDWLILNGDGIKGTLTYKTKGPKFDYAFAGKVKTTGSYTLIYVGPSGNYPCSGSMILGQGSFTAGSEGTLSGQVDTGDITNGKIWLVPTSAYSGGVMTSWPKTNILFETGLINYEKTS